MRVSFNPNTIKTPHFKGENHYNGKKYTHDCEETILGTKYLQEHIEYNEGDGSFVHIQTNKYGDVLNKYAYYPLTKTRINYLLDKSNLHHKTVTTTPEGTKTIVTDYKKREIYYCEQDSDGNIVAEASTKYPNGD